MREIKIKKSSSQETVPCGVGILDITTFKKPVITHVMCSVELDLDHLNRPVFMITAFNMETGVSQIVNCILDTGSPFTLISNRLKDVLNLTKISELKSLNYVSKDMIGGYAVKLLLVQDTIACEEIGLFEEKGSNIDVIVGTDILVNYFFEYNSSKGKFKFGVK